MSIMSELDIQLKNNCIKCKFFKICNKEINELFACHIIEIREANSYYGGRLE